MVFSKRANAVAAPSVAQVQPEKVVIVAGPTFGSAMSFVLFGAVIGAAATFYWQGQRGGSGPAVQSDDGVLEGLSAGGAKDTAGAEQLVNRLNNLSKRVKRLASQAKETAQNAAEVVGPTISEAVATAKTAAQEAEQQLHEDLSKPPVTVTGTPASEED